MPFLSCGDIEIEALSYIILAMFLMRRNIAFEGNLAVNLLQELWSWYNGRYKMEKKALFSYFHLYEFCFLRILHVFEVIFLFLKTLTRKKLTRIIHELKI